jgi:hypothetical protein
VRIDRLAEAETKGETISAGGKPLVFDKPAWLSAELSAV